MKKVLVVVALVMVSVIVYAFNDSGESNQGKKEVTGNGEVVVMDKEMFLKDVFDYEKSKEWKYKGDKPAIIDFYADWCGPCKMMKPVLEELKKKMGNKIIILKIDIDKNISLSSEYRIQSVPTLVLWKQGEIIWRQSGALSLNELEQILSSYIR